MSRLIVAIDGPSGAGKSTVSKLLAKKLGLVYIDTGAMYRAIALKSRELSVSAVDDDALGKIASDVNITFKRVDEANHTFLDGRDVTELIRAPEITMLTSIVSAVPSVREAMVKLQREMSRESGVIMDGRDIGTVVFPEADFKFFVDADLEVRGKRRYLELKESHAQNISAEETLADLIRRDKADTERAEAPLKRADDAIYVETSGLTADEVVKKIENIIIGDSKIKRD